MNQIIEQISHIGIVPVIAIDEAEKAVPLARALVAGGLPAAEVTFRPPRGGGHPPALLLRCQKCWWVPVPF